MSFLSFDPDSMATGGAGSVTGIGGAQPFLSPATFKADDDCCVLRAFAGARIIDRQHFIETAESIRDSESELKLEDRLRAVRRGFTRGDMDSNALRELGATADQLVLELNRLPDKPLRVSAAAGVYAMGQGDRFAGGAFSRHYLVLGAQIENDPEDLLRIAQIQAGAYSIANLIDSASHIEQLFHEVDWRRVEDLVRVSIETRELAAELEAYRDYPGIAPLIEAVRDFRDDLIDLDKHVDLKRLLIAVLPQDRDFNELDLSFADVDLRAYLRFQIPKRINSKIVYSGAEVNETGVNLSFTPPDLPNLSVGLNLKEVNFSTIAFTQPIDEFELEQYQSASTRLDYRYWDADIGARYQLNRRWSIGGVIKNLHRQDLATVLDQKIRLVPIARVGVAYQRSAMLLALDADLTKNEPLGFDADKQYLALGGQLRYWRRNTLSLGYRYNYVDRSGLPSAGLGFQLGPLTLGFAATYSSAQEEAGVSMQTGLAF